jgi:hypothetical protein
MAGGCPQCHSQTLDSRLVRRRIAQHSQAKVYSKVISLAFILIGIILVVVFGDEADISVISNQLLGFAVLGLGGLLLLFAVQRSAQKVKVQKKTCLNCDYHWEEVIK